MLTLLRHGAGKDKRDDKDGHVSTVEVLLLEACSDVNIFGEDAYGGFSALVIAAENGHVDIMEALIDAGAKLNAIGYDR